MDDTITLGQAGISVLDCLHKTPAEIERGMSYVGIPQMKTGKVTFDTARQISQRDYEEWTKKVAYQPYDVILSRRTNPGVTAVEKRGRKFALGQNLVLLRSDGSKVEPSFLRWWVSSPQWWDQIAKFQNVGAVFSSLRCRDIPKFELWLPSRDKQIAIAATLDALDDKIDLNRRMNKTLEAQARALFRDWFVDFGPTRAKMAGADPYLPVDLWSLFPDTLGDDGLPEGWTMKPFSDHIDIVGGGTPKTSVSEYWNGNIPWFSVKDTPSESDLYVFKTEKYISSDGLKNSSATLIPQGATIVSARGTVGNLALAGQEMTFNQSCYGILPKIKGSGLWVYFSTQHAVEALRGMAHGSVFSTITRSTFNNVQMPDFEVELLIRFEQIAKSWLDKIRNNGLENAKLTETRDYLLPHLMSGEVTVT